MVVIKSPKDPTIFCAQNPSLLFFNLDPCCLIALFCFSVRSWLFESARTGERAPEDAFLIDRPATAKQSSRQTPQGVFLPVTLIRCIS